MRILNTIAFLKIVYEDYHDDELGDRISPMTDKVFIENLSFRGKHGVYEHEWHNAQEFIIDISADVDLSVAAKSDKLEDTVCWTTMYDIAKDVIQGPLCYLIEKIAETIAMRILEDEKVLSVTVRVRKNEIVENAVPGVTITRTRQ